MYETKTEADHLKHCQPGNGYAALPAHGGRLLTMNQACLGATLSAFWSLGAGGLTTVKFANLLAL
jgi:hypothetical protein